MWADIRQTHDVRVIEDGSCPPELCGDVCFAVFQEVRARERGGEAKGAGAGRCIAHTALQSFKGCAHGGERGAWRGMAHGVGWCMSHSAWRRTCVAGCGVRNIERGVRVNVARRVVQGMKCGVGVWSVECGVQDASCNARTGGGTGAALSVRMRCTSRGMQAVAVAAALDDACSTHPEPSPSAPVCLGEATGSTLCDYQHRKACGCHAYRPSA
eukprot:360289-Chlamydomonas_euryale.AAC.2